MEIHTLFDDNIGMILAINNLWAYIYNDSWISEWLSDWLKYVETIKWERMTLSVCYYAQAFYSYLVTDNDSWSCLDIMSQPSPPQDFQKKWLKMKN